MARITMFISSSYRDYSSEYGLFCVTRRSLVESGLGFGRYAVKSNETLHVVEKTRACTGCIANCPPWFFTDSACTLMDCRSRGGEARKQTRL